MARIMVVENDDRLRELLQRQLAKLGHEVFAVADVAPALSCGWTGELAIVHLGVPGGGWERLGIPVVGTSGEPRHPSVPPGVVDLLRKPYTLAELGEVIGRHTR
ncbi:response regulator [Streptomyces sporangiiformans]|uniref:Response regulator n=1 Tax=Streptomyces sporangiiformans TaxID=2315329 RepID=A0A505DNT3_9ACTN|nr:response regulator [Streptomyces sporangiiformans]TPQ22891.1 response regulator [Streptomyces sporangiiformans]